MPAEVEASMGTYVGELSPGEPTVTARRSRGARAVAEVARLTPVLDRRTIAERAGARRARRAQGREPPAHRLVQGPRRGDQARRARRRRGARRDRRQRRQPRDGAGARRARARRAAARSFMPRRRAAREDRAAPQRSARPSSTGRGDGRRAASPSRASAPSAAGWRFVHPFDDPT